MNRRDENQETQGMETERLLEAIRTLGQYGAELISFSPSRWNSPRTKKLLELKAIAMEEGLIGANRKSPPKMDGSQWYGIELRFPSKDDQP